MNNPVEINRQSASACGGMNGGQAKWNLMKMRTKNLITLLGSALCLSLILELGTGIARDQAARVVLIAGLAFLITRIQQLEDQLREVRAVKPAS